MTTTTAPSVLIVEDDADLRQTITESLEAAGFAAAQAVDAADATERLKAFAYDAMVVDLMLPDASGMEVLDEAVGRYPQLPVVVITRFGGVDEAVKAMKRGAIDFLIKPLHLAGPARVLQAATDQRRLREDNAELRAQLRDRFRFENIIGRDSTMQHLFSTLALVAPM